MLFGTLWGVLSRPIPLVPGNAALVIAPQGPLVEQFEGDPIERAIAESLRRGPDADAAARPRRGDRRRRATMTASARSTSTSAGSTAAASPSSQEVAAAVDELPRERQARHRVFGDYYDQPQYYLAAHADEIYLDPSGIAFIDGFANYGMFVKDAIDKLSIDWNVFRVGQYKSAVETFSRNDMSPAEREESRAWLDSIWTT